MKSILRLILVSIFIALLSACGDKNQSKEPASAQEMITIDLNQEFESKPIPLSQIAKDIRVIRLSSEEESLMRYFRGFVGKKYIISVTRKNILQFDSNGKFIRTITRSGKGPREFSQMVMSWAVDDHEKHLFYNGFKNNYICKFNLETGEFEKDINIPIEHCSDIFNMASVNDTTLVIAPNKYKSSGYEYFSLSHSGRIIDGYKRKPIAKELWPKSFNKPTLKKADDEHLLLLTNQSEPMYRLDKKRRDPVLQIQGKDTTFIDEGFIVSFMNCTHTSEKYTYLTLSKVKEAFGAIMTAGDASYLYDKKKNETVEIKKFTYDTYGIPLGKRLMNLDRGVFYCSVNAIDLKNKLDKIIEKNELPKKEMEWVKNLQDKVSEDDNPVIFSGKWI
ncbi:hypothetical protein FUAX_10170 [Fulvitalea axinellae]|uniref:6-bladed beta-propeller n=1 Tax=Fulvitalea axinellae TaxID=1182444 RepID=A0AAU9CH70_9BACT|nr:hypothetical protein FUAX_10170 [Fulvitalea axinellae]